MLRGQVEEVSTYIYITTFNIQSLTTSNILLCLFTLLYSIYWLMSAGSMLARRDRECLPKVPRGSFPRRRPVSEWKYL